MAALTIDWVGALATPPYRALVTIPQDYDHMTEVTPGILYDLDTDAFWDDLKTLESAEVGIVFDDLQARNAAYTVAGTTYAPAVFMLSDVTFEDLGALAVYTVQLKGTNNDIWVTQAAGGVLLPQPNVIVSPGNSAGLVVTDVSGLTAGESAALLSIAIDTALSLALQTGIDARDMGAHITNPTLGKIQIVNDTAMRRWEGDAWEDVAETIPYNGGGLEVAGELTEIAY